jgi:predicted transcriptional regulator
MTAAETLKDARRRHGLTQRRLAYRSGVPQSTIARIESGSVEPSLATLNTILVGVGEVAGFGTAARPTTSDPAHVLAALERSPTDRLERMLAFARFAADVRQAGTASDDHTA